MHIEWITESSKDLEQPVQRRKELTFDNVIFKDLVGFFNASTLPLTH